MSLRNLLLFNLLILLFLSLSKELVINYLIKNANKIKDTSKKTRLKMLKDANLFYWTTKTLLRYSEIAIKLKDSRFRILIK
jgi:hypothetical protein